MNSDPLDLLQSVEVLTGIFSSVVSIVVLFLFVFIAIFAFTKVKGIAGKIIATGAIFNILNTLIGFYLHWVLPHRNIDMREISKYYIANGVFSAISNLIFLIGIFIILQNWNKKTSE